MTITSTTTFIVTSTAADYTTQPTSSISTIIYVVEVLNDTKMLGNTKVRDTEPFNQAVYLPLTVIFIVLLCSLILASCGWFHIRKGIHRARKTQNGG
jgi:phosphatidylserine synthase